MFEQAKLELFEIKNNCDHNFCDYCLLSLALDAGTVEPEILSRKKDDKRNDGLLAIKEIRRTVQWMQLTHHTDRKVQLWCR